MNGVRGIGVSPGRASGPVVVLGSQPAEPLADPVLALERVALDLEALAAELSGEPAEILSAQAAIAADPELAAAARAAESEGHGAAESLTLAARPFRAALEAARGEYQRQRVADIDEVVKRAVNRVEGRSDGERTPPVPGILVGLTISPADTAAVPFGQLLGIVSAEGGGQSHAAIVARSLGVPAVAGVDPARLAELEPGAWIEVDGDGGGVEILAGEPDRSRQAAAAPAATPIDSGHPYAARIRANVGSAAEAELAAANGLRSAGLVRTEFLLADRDALGVEAQLDAYRKVLAQLSGEVVFRLLDVGADKPHPGIPAVASPNPALGLRGARLLLRYPELVENQLRALCRLGVPERISVMVPMVTRVEELRELREIGATIFTAEGVRLPIGSMIEVPVAALSAAELAAECDFLSIGTNDLLQYLFAADRGIAELDGLAEPLPGSVWRLLRTVIAAGRAAGVPVGVCGELAADPEAAGALLALGAEYVSIGPAAAGAVSAAVSRRTEAQWGELACELSDGKGGRSGA